MEGFFKSDKTRYVTGVGTALLVNLALVVSSYVVKVKYQLTQLSNKGPQPKFVRVEVYYPLPNSTP